MNEIKNATETQEKDNGLDLFELSNFFRYQVMDSKLGPRYYMVPVYSDNPGPIEVTQKQYLEGIINHIRFMREHHLSAWMEIGNSEKAGLRYNGVGVLGVTRGNPTNVILLTQAFVDLSEEVKYTLFPHEHYHGLVRELTLMLTDEQESSFAPDSLMIKERDPKPVTVRIPAHAKAKVRGIALVNKVYRYDDIETISFVRD